MSRFIRIALLGVTVFMFFAGCAHSPERPAGNQMTHVASGRRLSDLKFTADLTRDQVSAVWGQPDGKRGSGVEYLAYKLKDGEEVLMEFLPEAPYRLHGAIVVFPRTGQHRILFAE